MDFICKVLKSFFQSPGETIIEWMIKGPLWLGLVLGGVWAFYVMKEKIEQVNMEREKKEVSESVQSLNRLIEDSRNSSKDIMDIMFENLKELREFYVISKIQIRRSFSLAVVSCFLGFVFFIIALIFFLIKGNNQASFIATLSGAIVEVIFGLFFWLYKATSKQVKKYYERLEKTEKYLIILQIVELLPHKNKTKEYKKVIEYMFREK